MGTVADFRNQLEKKYRDSPELFPDFTTIKHIAVVKSPSAIINTITGIGGLPRGRVTEIYGPLSSGKTTLATEIAATTQSEDPNACVLYLDYEHAWHAIYARTLGTDLSPDRLIYAQPQYFEQGADIAIGAVDAGLVDAIVVDSAAAMTPKAQMEGVMDTSGGTQKGTQASLMARFLERITKKISTGRKPALILLNQMRANIQIGGRPNPYAPKEISAANNAIKFYSTLRLELEIVKSEGEENRDTKGTDQVYTQNRVRVTCVKNKVASPFMRGQFIIEYGKGIDNVASIAELAEAKLGVMSGAGFFNYKGKTPETSFSCRGREGFLDYLRSHPATQKEIEESVLSLIRDEHAKNLGLENIKVQGEAKDISGTILETPTPTVGYSEQAMPIEDE